MLPATVQPEVLLGVPPDESLEGCGVAGGEGRDGGWLFPEVGGLEDFLNLQPVAHRFAQFGKSNHHYGRVVL